MQLQRRYIAKAMLLGGLYGLLLGNMTGFIFPAGLGLGLLLGLVIGYGQSLHLRLKQTAERLESPEGFRVSREDQFGVPLHRQQVLSLHRFNNSVRGERHRP